MAHYTATEIRNLAFVGHADAGKTSLVEALLQATGALSAAGSIERGNTVCDFDPQEKALQHSLETAICQFSVGTSHVNVVDTPGYPDFVGRSLGVLPAVETAAVVVNGQIGVEPVAEKMMKAAAQRGLCRLLVVNKIDDPQCDLEAVVSQLQSTFGAGCLPINLPTPARDAVIDCFFTPAEDEVTAFSSVATVHTRLIDQVVEVDEALMEVYLEQGQELDPAQLHDPFEKALREGHLIPICFTSAHTGAGLPELLQVIDRLMPNPLEGNPPLFLKGEGQDARPVEVVPDPQRHVVAHVFKVSVDPFVGKLGIFRIHQGTVRPNGQLFVGDGRKPFKVAHLLGLQGKRHVEMPYGVPGDICAVAKVNEIHFDAVLHDSHEEDHYHLKSMECPPPMYGLAIQTVRRGDEQKLSDALQKLEDEDPCLKVEHRASLNETVVRGTGELHLRVVLEKMRRQYNVEVETHPPSIAYRETISAPAEGHHRHKKQTGGAGQFGEVSLRVEPLKPGSGFEFVNQVVGGAIPAQFIPAIEKGVRQIMEAGAVAGFPLQDLRVTVCDGKHHPVDSKEIAFVTAGKKAFLNAIEKARPMVLEPIVNVRIVGPAHNMGDITGDLSARRGMITDTRTLSGNRVEISAQVPLSELTDYQSKLKSLTGGAGSYSMEFSHHTPVPPKKQTELIQAFRPGEAHQ